MSSAATIAPAISLTCSAIVVTDITNLHGKARSRYPCSRPIREIPYVTR